MWNKSSSINLANLVTVTATIPEITYRIFLGVYFFWRALYINMG